MRVRQWLRVRRVERAAGDRLRIERAHQRVGIHDRPARAVDEKCRWFHTRQRIVVDQLARLSRERWMKRDEVGVAEQLVQLYLLRRCAELSTRDKRISEEDAHVERLRARRDPTRDIAEADEPQRPAR